MCGAPVKSVLYSPEHTWGAPLTRKPGNSLAHRVVGNIMMDTGGRQRKLGFHTTLLMAVTGTAANHLEGCISRLWLHLSAKIIFAWVKSRNKMSSWTCPQHLCVKLLFKDKETHICQKLCERFKFDWKSISSIPKFLLKMSTALF